MSKKIVITIEEDDNGYSQGLNFTPFPGRRYNDPCEFCNNNPKNNPNASGVCSCALPALINNPIWC